MTVTNHDQADRNAEDDDEVAAVRQLDEELDQMDKELRSAWMEAQEKCPDLVGMRHKLMFLRCDRFHIQLAALRLVRYWSKRLELFGEKAAFLPLTSLEKGRSAMRVHAVDMETLQLGFFQWTGKHDNQGRGIFLGNPSKIPPGYSRGRSNRLVRLPSLCRVLWFVIHTALRESESLQTNGIVFLSDGRGYKFQNVDPTQSRTLIQSARGCLPLQLAAIHSCHPPAIIRCITFPFCTKRLMKHILLDVRTAFHCGSETKVVRELEAYGIPRSSLPQELGGEVLLPRHKAWIQDDNVKDNDDGDSSNNTHETTRNRSSSTESSGELSHEPM